MKQCGSQNRTFSLSGPCPSLTPLDAWPGWKRNASTVVEVTPQEPEGLDWPGSKLLPPPLLLSHSLHYQILELLHTWGGEKKKMCCCNINLPRKTCLEVQWLRLQASKAGYGVQSLVGDLRSHMSCSAVEKKNNSPEPARFTFFT